MVTYVVWVISFAGKLWQFVSLGQYIWVFIGSPLALPSLLGQPGAWPYYFALLMLPSLAYLGFAFYLPDSPKWLYIAKDDIAGAAKAVEFYHGSDAATGASANCQS